MDDVSQAELELRLARAESADSGGMLQPHLPWADLVAAAVSIVALSAALLWWAV